MIAYKVNSEIIFVAQEIALLIQGLFEVGVLTNLLNLLFTHGFIDLC